jgi:hypothetical protein
MGACMSSSNDEVEQKKKSQAIDKQLEEDSKRLRKECKILLLGMYGGARAQAVRSGGEDPSLICITRFGREWQVDNCEADENHSFERLFRR